MLSSNDIPESPFNWGSHIYVQKKKQQKQNITHAKNIARIM